MHKDHLKARVLEAERMLAVAETELNFAMNALEAGPRSQKMIASQAVEDAFSKLREARADVQKLVTLLSDDD